MPLLLIGRAVVPRQDVLNQGGEVDFEQFQFLGEHPILGDIQIKVNENR